MPIPSINSRVLPYVGDYGPADVLTDIALEGELRKRLYTGVELHFRRLAITTEQIETLDLPTKPRKPSDRSALRSRATVEAEPRPANTLRALLTEYTEALLSFGDRRRCHD